LRKFPVTAFFDNLENRRRGTWQRKVLHARRNPWFYPPNPNNRPQWDGTWASSGSMNFLGADMRVVTDAVMMQRRGVRLPPRAFLRFEHGFRFDAGARRFDGGIVEISVGGGPWRRVARFFTHGGYNGTIAKGRRNPLAGTRAFTGDSRGWGASRLDLSEFAGSAIRVRFRVATDRSIGSYGWYVDDIRIYRCLRDHDRPAGSITLARDAETVERPRVVVRIDAADATSGVARLRISNAGGTRNGLLRRALEMPYQESLTWLLTDARWGGTPQDGVKRVFVQLQDRAGNWSAVVSDRVMLDTTP
jgi:hypothetical protein